MVDHKWALTAYIEFDIFSRPLQTIGVAT